MALVNISALVLNIFGYIFLTSSESQKLNQISPLQEKALMFHSFFIG